jgi:hypothetical protein
MPSNPSDPIKTHRRKKAAERRLGARSKCSTCPENRPEAIVRGSKPQVCEACKRRAEGKSETDQHHLAGRNNHCVTVPIPVNDHRARLSLAQYEWPPKTLQNPDRSPLLAIAACIRGFIDFVQYCIDELLTRAAAFLESLDQWLIEKLGPDWWVDFTFNSISAKENQNDTA